MTGMTAEHKQLLDESINQWGRDQVLIDGAREQQKVLAATFEMKTGMRAADFVAVAKAYYDDKAEIERGKVSARYDLFLLAQGADEE